MTTPFQRCEAITGIGTRCARLAEGQREAISVCSIHLKVKKLFHDGNCQAPEQFTQCEAGTGYTLERCRSRAMAKRESLWLCQQHMGCSRMPRLFQTEGPHYSEPRAIDQRDSVLLSVFRSPSVEYFLCYHERMALRAEPQEARDEGHGEQTV